MIKAKAKTKVVVKKEEGQLEAETPPQRKQRGVFNGMRQKLQVMGEIKGYHLCWMNDTPGNIMAAQEGGYEFVSDKDVRMANNNVVSRNNSEGTQIKVLVGTNEDNSPMFAYLMKIPNEFYEEDQADIQEYNDKIDSQIKGGNIEGSVGQNGRYIPATGGISIK